MKKLKGRILSGIQPTGRLHLGNYLGALTNWVKLQEEYESFFEIADLHALTTAYEDTKAVREDTVQLAIDLLSAGIDPEAACLFVQSQVPEHSELHLLFSMFTPLSWLERVPTYKGKIEELKDKHLDTYGFLGYPVLQAADILIYKADTVPVGRDQLPHLELTREIVRRFNFLYGQVFPEPQEKLTEFPAVPGLDGRKMSKSYNNTIALSDAPETVAQKISQMITDPARIKRNDPGHPDICAVFAFHKIYSAAEIEKIKKECLDAQIGCVECKKNLASRVVADLKPIHEKRKYFEKNPGEVDRILKSGAARAGAVARATLQEVKRAMNLL